MASISGTFIVGGFSQMTCLPAWSAAIVAEKCRKFGNETATAVMSGSASISW